MIWLVYFSFALSSVYYVDSILFLYRNQSELLSILRAKDKANSDRFYYEFSHSLIPCLTHFPKFNSKMIEQTFESIRCMSLIIYSDIFIKDIMCWRRWYFPFAKVQIDNHVSCESSKALNQSVVFDIDASSDERRMYIWWFCETDVFVVKVILQNP